jgi:hypothetical protein
VWNESMRESKVQKTSAALEVLGCNDRLAI